MCSETSRLTRKKPPKPKTYGFDGEFEANKKAETIKNKEKQ